MCSQHTTKSWAGDFILFASIGIRIRIGVLFHHLNGTISSLKGRCRCYYFTVPISHTQKMHKIRTKHQDWKEKGKLP